MQGSGFQTRVVALFAATALCFSSTAAAAATPQLARAGSISPLVALSALASDASAAALCGASVTAAAAATASAAQAAQPGCVLPIVDTPAAPVVTEVLPPPPVAPPPVPAVGGGFGVSPLLLGLAAVAAAGLAYFLLRDKDENESPQ